MSAELQPLINYKGNNPIILSAQKNYRSAKASFLKVILGMIENENTKKTISSLDFSKYPRTPFEHQKEGVEWLIPKKRGMLAFEMGCGKSMTAIMAADMKGFKKILVVCPNSLKGNWKNEIKLLLPGENVISINALKHKTWPDCSNTRFVIANYDILKKFSAQIKNEGFECFIADECHYLKNPKALRTKSFKKTIAWKRAINVWLLTGTPVTTTPLDLFTLLGILQHPVGKNYINFGIRYCDGVKGEYGWEFKGASNLQELHLATQDSILRKTKEEVLKNLPPKIHKKHVLESDSLLEKKCKEYILDYYQKKYDNGDYDIFDNFDDRSEAIVELMLKRYFYALYKLDDPNYHELIELLLNQGKKLIIFTNFTKVVDAFKNKYGSSCLTMDGRVKSENRQAIAERFQTDESINMIVCNYKVGSVGLNLYASDTVIVHDPDWVPSTISQAIDRAHRIGQTKSVTAIMPFYENTTEETIYEVVKERMEMIDVIVDNKSSDTIKTKDMMEMIKLKEQTRITTLSF